MNRRQFVRATSGLAASVALAAASSADEPRVKGVVTGHPEAAQAGRAILEQGGNAVDAIVAGALAAGVVAVHSTGIAGYGGHLVVGGLKEGKIAAIDFNSAAPAALTPDFYRADEQGKVAGSANQYGWKSVGVPGVLAGLQLALDRYGTKPFSLLAQPAIRLAREGFTISQGVAEAIRKAAPRLAKDPGSAKLFLKDGEPPARGSTLRNPDLAKMLEDLAEEGSVSSFYKGKIAEKMAAQFRERGGLVTAQDLANYRPIELEPLTFTWNGCTIHTPPPTAGGLTVLQTLTTLQALGWPEAFAEANLRAQAFVEALRLAWSDRLRELGDPAHAEIPVKRLLSDATAKQAAEKIRRAVKEGKPLEGKSDGRTAGGTIHLNAVDSAGLCVALTFTHGESLGAQVTIDGLGLLLGHGLSRFDPRPGRSNSPAPGKRPLHNMCPTIVTKDGRPVLVLGATGGRRIVSSLCNVLAHRVGEGLLLDKAVRAPRIHSEGDKRLFLEKGHPEAAYLESLGYSIAVQDVASLHAIEFGSDLRTAQIAAQ